MQESVTTILIEPCLSLGTLYGVSKENLDKHTTEHSVTFMSLELTHRQNTSKLSMFLPLSPGNVELPFSQSVHGKGNTEDFHLAGVQQLYLYIPTMWLGLVPYRAPSQLQTLALLTVQRNSWFGPERQR